MDEHCPQCNSVSNSQSNRLIQDTCGHRKCRLCLLKDEHECFLCRQDKSKDETSATTHTPVITALNNEPASKSIKRSRKPSVKIKREAKRSYKYLVVPNHIQAIHNEQFTCYNCTICKKSFRTKAYIKWHQFCNNEDSNPFACSLCDKTFSTKYRLELHRVSHSGRTPFVCDVCKKGFIERSKLKRHQLCHTDAKPFVCPQCGKTFRSKESLKAHAFIHNNDKPFRCTQCPASFNNSSNLRKHLATHSKEKAHMCDQCGKRFKQQAALKIHRKSHLRLRPHTCHLCPKAFVNTKELHRHQLVHIDMKSYTCSLCNTSFRRKDSLERHIRNTHPGKKVTTIRNDVPLPPKPIAENPNAVNVIRSTLNEATKRITSKQVPVINAPLKLAFKTSAFKSHYNILSREYVEEKSMNIYQKILEPCTIPTLDKPVEDFCPKILCPMVPPISTQFFEKPHAVKNIKFKLPPKYLNVARTIEHIKPLEPVAGTDCNSAESEGRKKMYTELKPAFATPGVIVNGQVSSQGEMHWRRRTLQNLALQAKID